MNVMGKRTWISLEVVCCGPSPDWVWNTPPLILATLCLGGNQKRSACCGPTCSAGAPETIGERDKRIAELEAQLDTLKVIDQDVEQRRQSSQPPPGVQGELKGSLEKSYSRGLYAESTYREGVSSATGVKRLLKLIRTAS